MKWLNEIPDILFLGGLAAIVAGAFLVWFPLGLLVLGSVMVATAFLIGVRR